MKTVSTLARWVLGLGWITLAVLKALSPDSGKALAEIVPGWLAGPLAWLIVSVEFVVGCCLLWPAARTRSAAVTGSIVMLLAYGVYAVVRAPVRCTCAGRLIELTPIAHTLLTAIMLALSALAWKSVHGVTSGGTMKKPLVGGLLGGLILAAILFATKASPPEPVPTEDIAYTDTDRGNTVPGLASHGRVEGTPVTSPEPDLTTPEVVGSLRGTVADDDGEPLRGARVWLASNTAYVVAHATQISTSDEEGRFTLRPAVDPAPTSVLAFLDGYRPFVADLDSVPANDGVLSIRLQAGNEVYGLVNDPLGAPVAGATVEAWGRLSEDTAPGSGHLFGPLAVPVFARTTTKEDGTFVLSGLGDGSVTVHASKTGFWSPSEGDPPRAQPGAHVELELRQLYVASCIAIDGESEAVISAAAYQIMIDPSQGWMPAYDSTQRHAMTFPKDSGFYAAGGMRALFAPSKSAPSSGSVDIAISAPGFKRRTVRVPLVPLSEEPGPARAELIRALPEPLAAVSFNAEWRNGEPYTGTLILRVGIQSDTERSWVTKPMATRFDNGICRGQVELPQGNYAVHATGHEGSSRTLQVAAAFTPFDLRSTQPQLVRISVGGGRVLVAPRTEAGAPIREFICSLTGNAVATTIRTWQSAVPHERGEEPDQDAVFLYMDEGTLQILLKKDGFESARETLTVPADGSIVRWEPVLRESGD